MKKFILFFLGVVSLGVPSWQQNPIWALPNNSAGSGYYEVGNTQYLPFPTSDPITGDVYSGIYTSNPLEDGYNPSYIEHRGAANAISKPTGELLFFVVGNNIFDADGRTIYSNLYQIDDQSSGFSEIAVIPNPANCEQYYIITDRVVTGMPVGGEPILSSVYSILDVSATSNHPSIGDVNPNAQGGLITPFQDLLTLTPFTTSGYYGKQPDLSIATTPVNSNGERFLFVIQYIAGIPGAGQQALLKFKLSSAGISYVGHDLMLSITPADLPIDGRVELEVIEVGTNYRIATSTRNNLIIFDLDGATLNYISSSLHTPHLGVVSPQKYVNGIEFNTTGELVYFTRNPAPGSLLPNLLNCYSLVSNNFIPVYGASLLDDEFQFSQIEIGTDGNLYIVKNDAMAQISGINSPTSVVINSNFQPINYPANYWDYPFTNNFDKRYTLPDQIDGEDYAAHFSNNPVCCLTGFSYNANNYTATTSWTGGANQIWTPSLNPFSTSGLSEVHVYGTLTIPAGINVTISNMIFYFHPDAKVVVERSDNPALPNGARLNLNNTVFTVINDCGSSFMWHGVNVEGWSTQAQLPINNSRQGYLYVYNNSRIEHSIVGADTYQDDIYAADYPKPSYGGGIVRTNNATFFNNRIDVRITNYTHPPSAGVPVENQSTFMNTSFITNGIHNDPSLPPLSHAFLLNAGGIKFTGCTFENQTPNLYAELNRGRGIHNVNNKLTVIPGCSIPTVGCIPNDPCIFKDLASGVYSNSGSTLISTFVEGNQFINNFYGVYLGGLTGSSVQRNQFEVLNSQNPNILYNQTAGVFLNACTGYIITENSFTQTDGATALTNSRGVVVQNSGESHNEIYKNTFDNILVGGQSQSINGVNIDVTNPNNAEPVGLQWLCNDFQENIDVDLYVSSGRIDYQQGYYVVPSHPQAHFKGARNLFLQESGDYEIVMAPGTQSIIYTHYPNLNTTPITTLGFPGLIQIPISINYNISCPGKIKSTPGSGGISGPKNQLTQEIADLKALIDGGNTQTLLNVIATNSPGQAKNALIAASPYLSDEVLLAYLASNPSSGHAQQVMIANSPLSADVLAAFNAKNYPGGIKKQVNANQNGISPMTLLQNEINALTSERKFYVDELIRYYLNDSTVVNPMDSIITILIEEGDRISKEQLCDALIIKGDLASATFVRAQFIAEYGESNFTDLAEININTRTEEDPILVVHSDSTMHATVTDIATDTSDPRMCPRGEATLYDYAYSQAFVHNIEELYLPGQSPKSMLSQDSVLSTETSQITIYPNPATNHLYVAFENFEQTENISVDIYNLVGQKINSLILTQNQQIVKIDLVEVPAGVYIVQIKDQNGILNVQKVVIERQ